MMKTIVLQPTEENIYRCAMQLRQDGVVAFPTETVYGLGASAFSNAAAAKIFQIKGRPSDNPLIVHIGHKSQMDVVAAEIPARAQLLSEAFMPGPITLILKKNGLIPESVTAGRDTVGIRMPDHAVAQKLIMEAGLPLCAPSANTSTRPSPTSARHVLEDLNGKLQYILDGGDCRIGIESTILDLTGQKPRILREGDITQSQIEAVIGRVDVYHGNESLSPGLKYKHYAPRAKVLLFAHDASMEARILASMKKLAENDKKSVVLCYTNHMEHYKPYAAYTIGECTKEYAHNLYRAFRALDEQEYAYILCEAPRNMLTGRALYNRLYKAAGGQIL